MRWGSFAFALAAALYIPCFACKGRKEAADAGPGPSAKAVAISVAMTNACAVDEAGKVRCWGRSVDGVEPSYLDAYAPGTDIDVGGRATAIATNAHTCVVLEGGRLRCWGSNKEGQLGYPARKDVRATDVAKLGDVDVGGRVTKVTVAPQHTCVLLEDGQVRCWGLHEKTRISPGVVPRELPVVPLPARAIDVVCDGWSSCVLLETNKVRCWGDSVMAGEGFTEEEADVGEPAARFDASRRTNVITKSGRLVKLGLDEKKKLVKQETLAFDGRLLDHVTGGNAWCGLLEGGRVRCWGSSNRGGTNVGALGVPGLTEQSEKQPSGRDVDIGGKAVAIGANGGLLHCALREDGRIVCWGMVDLGEPVGSNTKIVGANETPAAYGPIRVFESLQR